MSLLPSHKSKFDKKLDELFGVKFDELDIGVINTLAGICPAKLLPILAASFDVDIDGLNEITARKLVKNAFSIHRLSGTAYAVRMAVASIDSGVLVIEGNLNQKHNASFSFDSVRRYGSNNHWAEYSIITTMPLSRQKAAQIADKAKSVAPVRCVLATIDARSGGLTYDKSIKYNNQFNYGVYNG